MRILPLWLPLLLLLTPAARAAATDINLRVTDATAGRTVFHQRLEPGGRFTLIYHHSVEKSPVEEVYEVAGDGAIFLVETTVRSSGYGLPECAPGQDCVVHDGQVTFPGLHLPVDPLIMRVSYLNDMWLIFQHEALNLRRVATGGNRILVQARPADESLAGSFRR